MALATPVVLWGVALAGAAGGDQGCLGKARGCVARGAALAAGLAQNGGGVCGRCKPLT